MTLTEAQPASGDSKIGFLKDICAYFRDFLDTDFKRQASPKRSVALKDAAGNLTGIDIAKYPNLAHDIWQLLRKPVGEGAAFSLTVPRGKYQGRIKRGLVDLIDKQVRAIGDEEFSAIADRASMNAHTAKSTFEDDLDQYREAVTGALRSDLLRTVIVPLLRKLEATLAEARGDAFESIYNIEEELSEALLEQAREPIGAALATALTEKSFDEFDSVLRDLIDAEALRNKIAAYFEAFVTTDFFQELHELTSTLKLRENFETYLYVCDIRFNSASYPIFYLSLSAELEDRVFRIAADPHLYVNKKALDFAAQEVARESSTPNLLKIDERILYLEPTQNFAAVMQAALDRWCADLALPPIDLGETGPLKSQRSQVAITNALHFAAFDKSDEALLNDYEDLMGLLKTEDPVALDFTDIVMSFLSKDSLSLETPVADEWDETPVDQRLVFASPVPLNEEQRKILAALHHSDCRFLAIEGPPGCGKSHTIVAIVFEAILTGKNVLVLSDKKEALDVVEDKLTKVLNSVRTENDFQNPILRLGRAGNTYGKILNPQSLEAIRTHHRVAEAKQKDLKRQIASEENVLKSQITETVQREAAIDLREIARLERREDEFPHVDAVEGILADDFQVSFIKDAYALAEWCSGQGAPLLRILRVSTGTLSLGQLMRLLRLQEAFARVPATDRNNLAAIRFFSGFAPHHNDVLQTYIRRYQALKKPLIGFVITRSKARAVDEEFGRQLPCKSALDAHRRLQSLVRASVTFSTLHAEFGKQGIAIDDHHLAYQQVIDGIPPLAEGVGRILGIASRLGENLARCDELASRLNITDSDLSWTEAGARRDSPLAEFAELAREYEAAKTAFASLPEFDYVGQKTKLESLQTQRLAHTIDERVVTFADQHKNLARALRDIIRKRQRFPREQFEHLKKAFPCMIAGIRDYAEYVPLEQGLFDIVIIDEASQVSIAQAFPAFVRAKQLVVLGDRHQFSNVKTSNASREINAKYTHDLIDNFRRGFGYDADTLNRLKMFNIKVSVLEFVERIANYSATLKKHFRGYPELISFSSKTFYRNQLQAVKIRGKAIDEVIRFQYLEDDGKHEVNRNINSVEAKAILEELRSLGSLANPPSVGIITPHTEQQAYLVQLINRQEDAEHLGEALDLKVMTFDTCQGEERDVILYSMVASSHSDKLAYIFPKTLEEADEVDHVLRLQRLNVGLSRAKERVHFFLSKQLDGYSGAIGKALQYVHGVLERERAAPQVADTDPRSPMEKNVLSWIKQTRFVQQFGVLIEIDAQFPIGDYLRQLDPTYQHPAYKVDFLIRISGEKPLLIIVEYDGFKEHFTNLDEVDASNYGLYMKADDVERQKVLESYGYRFLRLNRFNLGKDPVRTIDERLLRIAQSSLHTNEPHAFVKTVQAQTNGLANGDMRQCSVCSQVKPIEQFRDMNLASGYGRKCISCKKARRSRPRAG